MAKKKQEIALQKEILDDEGWEKELGHNGILVIDVYQKWSGPCKATVALFRRLKNELGDDLLAYAVAESDNISALSFYRGKCIPTFLIYADRKLQAVVRSCNAPLLERTINQHLAKEHKVQSGELERTEFVDPELEARVKAEEAARLEALKPKPIPKTCTVLIIKPDAVEAGHVEEILEKMRENGMEIWKTEERTLSEEETREMYKAHEEEPWFEELVELMTRGPCLVALVTKGATGEEVIPELRKLVGPTDAEQARDEDPESLRALYGTNKLLNGVHAADSKDQAASELAFFFPDSDLPMQEPVEPGQLQRTLAIIRPDAYRERGDEILSQIKASGFTVALRKEMTLTREQVEEFYVDQKDEPHFEMLVENMTSGPLLALGLAREEAIGRWRDMLGPKEKEKAVQEAPQSLRAQFDVEEIPINQIHGSDSEENAEKEINFFFPKQETLIAIKPNAMHEKEEIMAKISEAGFKVSHQKQSHLTREMAENFYSEHKDKDFFPQLVDFMSGGETLFCVLTKEDAISGFRELCGNKDPEEAKNRDPDSLRAMFGDDILKNAIHSSATQEEAFEKIAKIFDEEERASRAASAAAGEEEMAAEQEGVAPAEQEEMAVQSAEEDGEKGEEDEKVENEGVATGEQQEGGDSAEAAPVEQEAEQSPAEDQTEAAPEASTEQEQEEKPDEAAAAEAEQSAESNDAPAEQEATAAGGGEAAPAEGGEAAPAEGGEAAPAEGGVENKTDEEKKEGEVDKPAEQTEQTAAA